MLTLVCIFLHIKHQHLVTNHSPGVFIITTHLIQKGFEEEMLINGAVIKKLLFTTRFILLK